MVLLQEIDRQTGYLYLQREREKKRNISIDKGERVELLYYSVRKSLQFVKISHLDIAKD